MVTGYEGLWSRSACYWWANAGAVWQLSDEPAFPEPWLAKLTERCVWLHELETFNQARGEIAAYVDRDHHSGHANTDPSPNTGAEH